MNGNEMYADYWAKQKEQAINLTDNFNQRSFLEAMKMEAMRLANNGDPSRRLPVVVRIYRETDQANRTLLHMA